MSEGGNDKSPELVRRREHRKSTIRAGRTIGEARERLETKSERAAARKKDKMKNFRRIAIVSVVFVALVVILIGLGCAFLSGSGEGTEPVPVQAAATTYAPTIEIVDEDASATGGKITSRMREYIGMAEADFRDLGYQPVRAVIPAGAIREVDFYLEGYSGFIKLTIDRVTAVSVEDADRMLRYLASLGVTDFRYIDVRLDGKAYWR